MTDQFECAFVTGFRDIEVNCLYKTRWDSYPGIGQEKKILFIKKTCPTFYSNKINSKKLWFPAKMDDKKNQHVEKKLC